MLSPSFGFTVKNNKEFENINTSPLHFFPYALESTVLNILGLLAYWGCLIYVAMQNLEEGIKSFEILRKV